MLAGRLNCLNVRLGYVIHSPTWLVASGYMAYTKYKNIYSYSSTDNYKIRS